MQSTTTAWLVTFYCCSMTIHTPEALEVRYSQHPFFYIMHRSSFVHLCRSQRDTHPPIASKSFAMSFKLIAFTEICFSRRIFNTNFDLLGACSSTSFRKEVSIQFFSVLYAETLLCSLTYMLRSSGTGDIAPTKLIITATSRCSLYNRFTRSRMSF